MSSAAAVLLLLFLAYAGVGLLGLRALFGVVLPYGALLFFLAGFSYRIIRWARVPVPFRIPTTCGQQRSLPWIHSSPIENPHTRIGVAGRVALEVLLFRSLFRNTTTDVAHGRVGHASTKWLWAASLAFHWCLLIVLLRHFRFFTEPVPAVVAQLVALDGVFRIGLPSLYVTSVLLLFATTFLFFRRILLPQVRYISLPADYFPLFLILAIAITGILLRHVVRTDIVSVKEWAIGLVSFHPVTAEGVHWLFFGHLFLVSVLLIYFPLGKLMHMGGVFLSPTRNLTCNSRESRHVNPWDQPVPTHTYQEYEEEFREKMVGAGIPVEPLKPRDKE